MLDPKQLQKWSAGQNHERPPLPITAACSCMMIHENNCINNYRKQLCCRMHKNTPRYLRLSVFVSLSIFFIIKEKATKLLCLLESFIPLLLKNNIHDIFVLMEERQRTFLLSNPYYFFFGFRNGGLWWWPKGHRLSVTHSPLPT